ncbi:MAG: response regulator [Gemmatimonas sp.]
MTTVVIIEDDQFKQKRIEEAVREIAPGATIVSARSVNSGMESIEEHNPTCILLDMSLTTFDIGPEDAGGRPQNFGGLEVLRQMDRLGLNIPTIVITQHVRFTKGSDEVKLDVVSQELAHEHPNVFRGLIYYNSAQGQWKSTLRKFILEVFRQRGNARDDLHPRR